MAKRKTVYSQAVIDFIKDSIKKQRLLPGQKVCEQGIASEMSVSRAPVREALNVLLGEGLVISGPHLGKRVTALSVQEIRDAYTLGGAVYGVMLAASAPQYTAKDFSHLESVRQGFKDQTENGLKSHDDFEKLRYRLHDVMLQYALRRWDTRLIVFCGNLSCCLLHKTHRRVLTPADYLNYTEGFIQAAKKRDGQALENGARAFFDVLGSRLCIAGYDHEESEYSFALDKKFHMHKRRQPAIRVAV